MVVRQNVLSASMLTNVKNVSGQQLIQQLSYNSEIYYSTLKIKQKKKKEKYNNRRQNKLEFTLNLLTLTP